VLMIRRLLLGASLLCATGAGAQTLFTYGTDSVSAPEFLAAYRRLGAKPFKEALYATH